MTDQVSTFFDEMCREFLEPRMTKYINMEKLREDFIRETTIAIAGMKQSYARGEDPESTEYCEDIPFWFNSFDPCDRVFEAESRIFDFVENMAKGNVPVKNPIEEIDSDEDDQGNDSAAEDEKREEILRDIYE